MCVCCCVTCFCKNSKMKLINILYILFISISIFFSLLTCIILSNKTSRYSEALKYLKEINEQKKSNIRLLNNRTRTIINYNGEQYYINEEEISYQNVFKNWKKIELPFNLIRLFLYLPLLYFSYHFLSLRLKSLDLNENILIKTAKLAMINFIFLIVCLIFNICLIYLRILTISTDEEIGLYKVNKITNFVKYTSLNIFFDVIIIILNSICLGLSFRIYENAKYNKGKNCPIIDKQKQNNIPNVNSTNNLNSENKINNDNNIENNNVDEINEKYDEKKNDDEINEKYNV